MITIRLYDWAVHYVRNRDLIVRNIVNITEDGDHFFVEFRNKKTVFLVAPQIEDLSAILKRLEGFSEHQPALVLLNTKKNFDHIVENWKPICGFHRFFCIIFANPDSETEESKWVVFPHTHSMITDEASLKPGLKSMAELVELVDEKDISKYI